MERVLGAAIGDAVKALHEAHGVIFHLETTLTAIHPARVTLSTGADLAADLVVTGIGVRPAIALAEAAGLATAPGVLVGAFCETSAPGLIAARGNERCPDAQTDDNTRGRGRAPRRDSGWTYGLDIACA